MTIILAAQAEETRTKGEALIKQADRLLCESWTNGCGPTASQSIRRQRSTSQSMATSREDLAYGSGIVPVPLQLGDQSLLPGDGFRPDDMPFGHR